jgi:hypothetical protein
MIAQQLENLEYLDVSKTRLITNKSWLVLCALNDNLQHLNVSNCFHLDWDLVGGILPSQIRYLDISSNFSISFDYLYRLVQARERLGPHLVIDIRNCGNLTGDEVDELRSLNDAITLVANPILRNHSHDGVREYLEYIMGAS